MQNQKSIRQRVEVIFGLPAMKMPWSLYIAQLNEAGKLTARSTMDILTVILESLEQMENEIRDLKLISESRDVLVETPPEPPKEEKTAKEEVKANG